jgi:hypothetical protein
MINLSHKISQDPTTLNDTKIAGYSFINSLNSSIILKGYTFVFDFVKNISTASINLNVDGSTTEQIYRYSAPSAFSFLPKDIRFIITGSGNFTADRFGNLSAITNGVTFSFRNQDGTLIADPLGGESIKTNADFYLLAGSSPLAETFVAVSFNILTVGAALYMPPNSYVEVRVRDNLSTLGSFRVSVNGLLMPGEITFSE